jgi:RNA polymerase sigma-70 factor (ECF subfamily)
MGPLTSAFVAALGDGAAPTAQAIAGLEETLETLYVSSRAMCPSIDLGAEDYVRHLARHVANEPELEEAIHATHGADLYLACASARGDDRALAILEREFLRGIPSAIARLRLARSSVDEVQQLVRERLLLGKGGAAPKIAEYSGRGPLASWVRVVAKRSALNFMRTRDGATHPDEVLADRALAGMPSGTGDPELDVVRARCAGEFKAALEGALAKLPAEERTLLRLHYVDGLNIDELGGVYRVHRATIARWIAKTRDGLLSETRRVLTKELRLTNKEFQSLVASMQSQIHVSIHRLLGREGA